MALTKVKGSVDQVINSIISLRNVNSDIGNFITILGHTTPLDGGAGSFYRDDTDTTSVDDNGTIIVDATGKRWKRIYSGPVNVKWFGAVGNGITNDRAAFVAADAIGPVYVPAGNYRIETSMGLEHEHIFDGGSFSLPSTAHILFLYPLKEIHAKWFGVVGDGITDDSDALDRALYSASQSGIFTVILDSTDYGYVVRHNVITVYEGVTLKGHESLYVPNLYSEFTSDWKRGVTLLPTTGSGTTSGELIALNDGATVTGINIYYPNQTDTNPPLSYPPTFRLIDSVANCVVIRDVCMMNSFIGIDASAPHQQMLVENVVGQCLFRGIIIDNAVSVDRLHNVDFGPYVNRSNHFDNWEDNTKVAWYTSENGVAFEIRRADDFIMSNCFAFGFMTGVLFQAGSGGGAYGKLNACGFDYCRFCIDVANEGTNANGLLVSNCTFIPSSKVHAPLGSFGLVTNNSNNANISLSNCSFWGEAGEIESAAYISTGYIRMSNCHFRNWGTGKGAVQMDGAGHLSLTGVRFGPLPSSGSHLAINSSSTGVYQLTGCQFDNTRSDFNPGSKPIFEVNSVVY